MNTRNLGQTGLSLTQAQAISNLINQQCNDIVRLFEGINNASKTVAFEGEKYIETEGKKMPEKAVELILEKGKLHGLQAFLMENITMKSSLLDVAKFKKFEYDVEQPELAKNVACETLEEVDEEWGWNQLTNGHHRDIERLELLFLHERNIEQNVDRRAVLNYDCICRRGELVGGDECCADAGQSDCDFDRVLIDREFDFFPAQVGKHHQAAEQAARARDGECVPGDELDEDAAHAPKQSRRQHGEGTFCGLFHTYQFEGSALDLPTKTNEGSALALLPKGQCPFGIP